MVRLFLLPENSSVVDSRDLLLGLLVGDLRGDMVVGSLLPVVLTMLLSLVDFLVPLRGDLDTLALLLEGPGDSGAV